MNFFSTKVKIERVTQKKETKNRYLIRKSRLRKLDLIFLI